MRYYMEYYPEYKCWVVMKCENQDCHARHEPKTPCWEITGRVEAYHDFSNTFIDCADYILKKEFSIGGVQKLHNIITKRTHLKNSRKNHEDCIGNQQ